MTLAQPALKSPASSVTSRPTVHHLMDSPLDALLAEFGVDVSVLEAEPGFTGGAYVRRDGSLVFVKPAGRSVAEWELTARAMLGRALRVPLPDLPQPFELTEF